MGPGVAMPLCSVQLWQSMIEGAYRQQSLLVKQALNYFTHFKAVDMILDHKCVHPYPNTQHLTFHVFIRATNSTNLLGGG